MLQTNGSLLLSDKSTDLAISGDGWFAVQGQGSPIYTRDGNFTFDANDDLVTYDGMHVLGTKGNNISADNVLTSKLNEIVLGSVNTQEKLRFPKSLTYPPKPTTNAKFRVNVAMDVESNNIANVNTVGFKYSRANFSDLLAQTKAIATAPQGQLGGKNPVQVGLGSAVSSMTRIFSQGSVQNPDKIPTLLSKVMDFL